jgi:regulator of sigma E protease
MSIPLLQDIGYFLVALAILISVHELGHFWVARWLGVGVIRFSIGLGRPLLRYQRRADSTEYVLAVIPLGGYVKMIDEREEEVPPGQLHLAFNRQSLWKRTAIVAAGPAFNFFFAILAYWAVFTAGETGLRAVVESVEPNSIAAQAGFREGDQLLSVRNRDATIWEHAAFAFTLESFGSEELVVRVRDAAGNERDRWIEGGPLAALPDGGSILRQLGFNPRPIHLPAIIGELVAGEPAERAGLQLGDHILTADGRPIEDWAQWVETVKARPDQAIQVEIDRSGVRLTVVVTPRAQEKEGTRIGRIGAGVRMDQTVVRYAPLAALGQALGKTLDMSLLSLRMMGRMLVGQASVQNLGGPITMAKAAGTTGSRGWESFMRFLAVVSLSLGVLNLLPIPILDGGHLVYFLIEWIKGSPVSEYVQLQGQKVGIVLIAGLMGLAFYVDIARFFG